MGADHVLRLPNSRDARPVGLTPHLAPLHQRTLAPAAPVPAGASRGRTSPPRCGMRAKSAARVSELGPQRNPPAAASGESRSR
eukprot:3815882-Pleurochrysis_carterae.AAC.3